jgi:hypothetical protein
VPNSLKRAKARLLFFRVLCVLSWQFRSRVRPFRGSKSLPAIDNTRVTCDLAKHSRPSAVLTFPAFLRSLRCLLCAFPHSPANAYFGFVVLYPKTAHFWQNLSSLFSLFAPVQNLWLRLCRAGPFVIFRVHWRPLVAPSCRAKAIARRQEPSAFGFPRCWSASAVSIQLGGKRLRRRFLRKARLATFHVE